MVYGLVRAGGVAVDEAAGWLSEQERCELLPDCSTRGIVERAAGKVGSEVVATGRMPKPERVLAVGPEVISHPDLMTTAENLGQCGLERVNVVVGRTAQAVAEERESSDLKPRQVRNAPK